MKERILERDRRLRCERMSQGRRPLVEAPDPCIEKERRGLADTVVGRKLEAQGLGGSGKGSLARDLLPVAHDSPRFGAGRLHGSVQDDRKQTLRIVRGSERVTDE